MKFTGARIVIESLLERGVTTVFGYPGGAILNIYDELYKNADRITHILTAHEQGAAHAADGYARSTGSVGVVFATSGPGATNLITGIATAYMDSVPIVAITCNVPSSLLGKDSFQEIDITGITLPITKHNYIVRDVNNLANTIHEAFDIAISGRPGPVLIDIPKDITSAVCEWSPCVDGSTSRRQIAGKGRGMKAVDEVDLSRAATMLAEAKRPFFYIGGGVISADATDELTVLAQRLSTPVAVSLMGKSGFPARHELCTGMIGMHGTKASNTAANRCDLLVAIGARFSDRVISDPSRFAKESAILQIDIDPAEINKNIRTHASLTGDIKAILADLATRVPERRRDKWNDLIDELKTHLPAMYTKPTALHPRFVLEGVNKILGDDTIITTEVGQHQMWVAQFYPFSKPRTFITSGGLGTMGFGTGAAIGAQIANPDRRVVHIAGDGSFRMNLNELATISYYNLPIIIIVANNGTLGMVRQWQKLFYDKRYSATTLDRPPDFLKLADAFAVRGFRARTEDEFLTAFKIAVASREPTLIDCYMDIDEMVFPMVPPGKPIDELLLDVQS